MNWNRKVTIEDLVWVGVLTFSITGLFIGLFLFFEGIQPMQNKIDEFSKILAPENLECVERVYVEVCVEHCQNDDGDKMFNCWKNCMDNNHTICKTYQLKIPVEVVEGWR